jgi:hypothetical protein
VLRDGAPFASGAGTTYTGFTPNRDGTYVVTLTATTTGANPQSGSISATIPVTNLPPAPVITGAPASALEGTPIQFGITPNDPGSADTFAYQWTVTGTDIHGQPIALTTGHGATYKFTPGEAGTYNVALRVTDDGGTGLSATTSKTIAVTLATPQVTIVNGATIVNGSGVLTQLGLAAQATDGGLADSFTYGWTLNYLDSSSISHPLQYHVCPEPVSGVLHGRGHRDGRRPGGAARHCHQHGPGTRCEPDLHAAVDSSAGQHAIHSPGSGQ